MGFSRILLLHKKVWTPIWLFEFLYYIRGLIRPLQWLDGDIRETSYVMNRNQ